jgi:cell wall-associated NlpC family hydrolase
MTKKRSILSIPVRLQAVMLAAAMSLSSAAWSNDAPSPDEPNGPLARLQHLTGRASDLAVRAMAMVGIRYKYGGDSPESGLDCSGLVRHVFREAWGAKLPRTSEEISRVGARIDSQDLQPGDLVFFNTLKRTFSHVGIYLGDNKFIHSPTPGSNVRIESMDLKYWKARFNGARRISDPDQQ